MSVLAVRSVLTGQLLGAGDFISQIISVVYILFFVVFIFYGQRIQMYAAIREVESSLYKLKYMREEAQVYNLENTLEAAMAINFIFKVVRHFYIQGKKTLSFYTILQLQMILPLVMKEAEAYVRAVKAFANGQPIGDGAGPLVAAKLMHGYEIRKVPKDCVAATVPFEGRTALVIKAEGPGGNVGKPGDAVKAVIEENEGKIAMVIMIDAGLKLEGEPVGEVSEGIGAAIGGPGVDQYKIEESLVEYHIPINAVIVKEDIGDAVSPMRKEISDAIDKAIERVKSVILERKKEGEKIIIVGVGNPIGIGQ